MNNAAIEPGLLSIFRLLIGVNLFWALLRVNVNDQYLQTPLVLVVSIGLPVFLLLYLWPYWHRYLGRAFLPIAFCIALIAPLLDHYLSFQLTVPIELTGEVYAAMILRRSSIETLLLVILIGWHYRWQIAVVLISAGYLLEIVILWVLIDNLRIVYPRPPLIMMLLPMGMIFAGGVAAWLLNRLQDQRLALAVANDKIASYAATIEQLTISQERNRMARELHDTLAHSLSGATVQQEAVVALWEEDPPAARAMLYKSLQTTRSGLMEARRALEELRAAPLDDLGLGLALESLAKEIAQRANITLHCELPKRIAALSPAIEQCIYRVAQESMTNVLRHAQATEMTLCLTQENGQICLTITDNGRGFDTFAHPKERFGLTGMRERAEMAGGYIAIDSRPNQGTTVQLTLPQGDILAQRRYNEVSGEAS